MTPIPTSAASPQIRIVRRSKPAAKILAIQTGKRKRETLSVSDFLKNRSLWEPSRPKTGMGQAETAQAEVDAAEILFIGNTCGVSYVLANEAVKAGVSARVVAPDYVSQGSGPLLIGTSGMVDLAVSNDDQVQIIEARAATDRPVLLKRKKKVVLYHGTDLRTGYAVRATPAFVTTRDMLPLLPGASLLHRPVDPSIFRPDERIRKAKEAYKSRFGIERIVGHFPTNRGTKGSDAVDAAIRAAMAQRSWEYVTLSGASLVSAWVLPSIFAWCDYVIDWINPSFGIYGLVAVQAAFCGAVPVASVNAEHLDSPELEGEIINVKTATEAVEAIGHGEKPKGDGSGLRGFYSSKVAYGHFAGQLKEWGLSK